MQFQFTTVLLKLRFKGEMCHFTPLMSLKVIAIVFDATIVEQKLCTLPCSKIIIFKLDQPVLILCIGWSSQVSMGNLALSFRMDYSSILMFVNPVFKCCRHLTNGWCLCQCPQNWTIYKNIIYIYISVGYLVRTILKDEKQKLGGINELWIIYCYCVNTM